MKGLKYFLLSLAVVALFVITRNDLLKIRGLATDTTFFTTQLAELTRLEKEKLQFRVSAAAVFRGDEVAANRDRMLLAFDILWSRVHTEHTRFINPKIDALRNYKETLGKLSRDLRTIDPLVQALQPGDDAAWREIERVMDKTAAAIAVMTNDSYDELYSRATRTTVLQREALRGLDHFVQVFVGIILFGVFMLLWQLRRSEKLYHALELREAEITRLATIDPLTELKNRRHFDERMAAIDSGTWRGDLHTILIDLDGFKHVNDTNGHAAGDYLLKIVAKRFPVAVGYDVLLARLGGDEFAVVIDGPLSEALRIAGRIIEEVAQPIIHGGEILKVGASVGISSIKNVPSPSSMMLREADMALYEAKFRGKGIALHHNDLQLGHGSRVSALTPLQSRFAAQ